MFLDLLNKDWRLIMNILGNMMTFLDLTDADELEDAIQTLRGYPATWSRDIDFLIHSDNDEVIINNLSNEAHGLIDKLQAVLVRLDEIYNTLK